MITGSSERALISRHSESPSRPGSMRSRITRLGVSASSTSRATYPSAACERPVARRLEVADDDIAHGRLVVDNENGGHIGIVEGGDGPRR